MKISLLLKQARACRICEPHLPHGCKPLLQGADSSRILVIGQAPGAAAHESGVPWDDKSGDRLRDWLGVTREEFYDPNLFALMPMGFCYPGTGTSGDLRPRPECAPEWHQRLLDAYEPFALTLYTGRYAYERYIGDRYSTLTDAVRAHAQTLPKRMALPHPSPRNNLWLKRNPWFEAQVLPAVQRRVRRVIRSAERDVPLR